MEDISVILKRHWGYDSFRPMQREIIESVLAGHDTLGLMPTGGGKSITFQVPGLALGGLTLVITPLVALMKDQVDNLRSHGIKAAFLHCGMPYSETSRVWQSLLHGNCKFLYVSPERLQNERFCEELRALKRVTLVVVDEAHCISQWGYDFRPSYLNIARLRKLLPPTPFMAVTASATPLVAEDICRLLDFRSPRTFATSFARPNISYVVRHTSAKIQQISHILNRVPGTAIVYVRSRRRTVEIARQLMAEGLQAAPFHAGLDYEVKEQRINEWKSGNLRVMVSTNAFGMGIDKPDVRVVIHYDMPPSIEEYYQEAGRAGRDGLPSYAVLLIDRFDVSRMRRRVTESFPPRDVLERNYELLCNFLGLSLGEGYNRLIEFDLQKFLDVFKLQEQQVRASLAILGASGYLQFVDETENASRAMILCTKEELYSMPYAGPHTDSIMRALLRDCPGLFADYVYFSEARIAADADCTPQDVYDTLLALSRMGVVSYVPASAPPTFSCVPPANSPSSSLSREPSIMNAGERMRERVESMIGYAMNEYACRPSKILEYFGEKDPASCGSCDVCRASRKPMDASRLREMQRSLTEFLDKNPDGLTLPQITHQYGAHARRVAEIIDYMVDEKLVSLKEGRYTLVS